MAKNFPIFMTILFVLYLALGILLFKAVPVFQDLYASMYSNWNESENAYLTLFKLPKLVWLLIGLGFAFNVVLVNFFIKNPIFKARFNIVMLVLWVIFVIHAIDLLYGFMFCHEWGCSTRYLPTWRLFGLS